MKMGTIASPFPYDTAARDRVPIGKAATAYGFALRLVACGLHDLAGGLVDIGPLG